MATLQENFLDFTNTVKNNFNSLRESISYAINPNIRKQLEEPLEKINNSGQTTEVKDELTKWDEADIVNSASFSTVFNIGYGNKISLNRLIQTYREVCLNSFVNDAIDEIVNTTIYLDDYRNEKPIRIAFKKDNKDSNIPESIKEKIIEEFEILLENINFDNRGQSIFKKWLIDGRIIVQPIYKKDSIKGGIFDIKLFDPLFWKLVWDADKNEKYWKFVYSEDTKQKFVRTNAITNNENKIMPETLMFKVESGMKDPEEITYISFLHYAIKDINRLLTLEDHYLIYTIVRAPERRVFYIDPGNLPARKAEEYLKNVIKTYSQKKYYNEETGSLMSKSQHPSILEDFFLLRKNGKGT
jgi:hypothetical protein